MRPETAGRVFGGRVLTAALMFSIFAAMTLMALGFPGKARWMPLMVGVPGTALSLIAAFQELRAVARESAVPPHESARAERWMLAWTVGFFAGILGFGFLRAAPALVFAFLCFGKRESLVTSVAGAAATWGVLYGVFERVFQIPLFGGLVIERLAG